MGLLKLLHGIIKLHCSWSVEVSRALNIATDCARRICAIGQDAKRRRKRLAEQISQEEASKPVSAELVAQAVQNSKDAPKEAAEAQVNHGRGPRGVMKAWANMSPDAAVRHLQQRAETLKLSSQQGSGPAVASGLRAWHQFAVSFLEYPPDETLPPKRAGDVLKFIAVFSSAGTAKNYIGYLAWACKFRALSLEWRSQEIDLALRGLLKTEQSMGRSCMDSVPVLSAQIVAQLVHICDSLPGFSDDADLYVLAWQFLLRVQSEAVSLQGGAESEAAGLPQGRHSGVWVDSNFVCHLQLRKRKHMPKGSVMTRPCTCRGSEPDRLCASHRLHRRLQQTAPGQALFNKTAPQLLKRFRDLLSLLKIPGSERFGFKAFRAGKATDLAKSGCPVHIIMMMGQWRSAALLRYVRPDALDEGVFWKEVANEPESEE